MQFPRKLIWMDMVLCGLFALPGISDLVINGLNLLNTMLDLPGEAIALSPGTGFFVNFGGLLGVCFNIALLDETRLPLHRTNQVARIMVIGLVFFHIIISGLPGIFLAVVGTELVGLFFTWRWLRSK